MAKDQTVRVGFWKIVFMLLITWLTPFVGLGNLIFLWSDKSFRLRAIIALAVTLAIAVPLYPLYAGFFIHLGMAIWMTLDAITAFRRCQAARGSRSAAA